MSYLKKTIKGTTWIGGFRLVSRLISFTKLGLIARLLSPEQFGIYGIATLVLAFLEIFTETGINTVLIQKKKTINNYINTAWCVSIVRGIGMSSVIYASSGLVGYFFGNEESIHLLKTISIVPLIRGFINPSVVKFQKDLEFAKEFWYRLIVFLVDAVVAVVAVYLTHSPNGLIVGFIAGAIIELGFSFLYASPRPQFTYDYNQIKEIVTKGKWITASRISEYLFGQGDDVVVGKLLGTGSLGIYQAAYKLSTLPVSEVADVIGKVTFPVLVKLSTEKDRVKEAYTKIVWVNFGAAVMLGFVLFVFVHPIVQFLLGSQWSGVETIARILIFFGISKAVTTSFYTLFYSFGRQDIVTKITVINTVALGLILYPALRVGGLEGVSYAVLISSLVGLPYAYSKQQSLLRSSQ